MKRLTCVFAIVIGLAATAAIPLFAVGDERSVTGAGKAVFAAGAALGAIALQSVELGTGVFLEPDGSGSGTFHAVLQGSTLGQPRAITVEGKVAQGSVAADGRATFSGTASLDFGDGTPPLPGVAFTVIAGADGLVLSIDSTTLPAAGLTAGAITVE